jgi:hypothetical protein
MNIYELIEVAHLERQQLTDSLRNRIIDSYPWRCWDQAGVVFLKGLDRNHQIPGKEIAVMLGIMDVTQQHIELTRKQKWFFVNHIIDYWDQMGCEARASLML